MEFLSGPAQVRFEAVGQGRESIEDLAVLWLDLEATEEVFVEDQRASGSGGDVQPGGEVLEDLARHSPAKATGDAPSLAAHPRVG
jgi:hypothetical protein